jgi:4-hydroxybenzoate polyprenyltransferase
MAGLMARASKLGRLAGELVEFVKFQHTLFALPFILASMLVAAAGWPAWWQVGWIVAAAVGARTTAMAFNRIVDRDLDAANVRTQGRALPAGRLSPAAAYGLMIVAAGLFVFAAWQLNLLCFVLSFAALAVICGYSYAKRFTAWSHAWLGLALAIGPVGAWLAVQGALSLPPVALAFAVLCWVAGFDIIYATQDLEFDRLTGLHSAVVRFGLGRSLIIAAGLHGLFVLGLALFGLLAGLGRIYAAGVVVTTVLVVWQHSLVSPTDLRRADQAFFVLNAAASVVILAATVMDVWLQAAG